MSNENDDRQIRMDLEFTETVEYASTPEEDKLSDVRFHETTSADGESIEPEGLPEIYVTPFVPKSASAQEEGRPSPSSDTDSEKPISSIRVRPKRKYPAQKSSAYAPSTDNTVQDEVVSPLVSQEDEQKESEDNNGNNVEVFDTSAENISSDMSEATEDISDNTLNAGNSTPYTESDSSENVSEIFDEYPQQKVLTSFIEKPQILLETPYSVLTKFGPRLRYRVEYGYPDTRIPDEDQALPADSYSPMELDAMNQSTPIAEGEKPQKNKKRKSVGQRIFSWVKIIVAALILALLIRQFVFVFVWVEGSSMHPTLVNQERVIVTKYDYIFGSPERQDIIICHFPNDETNNYYVKRIIGLPGERISIHYGAVFINGKQLDEPYIVNEKVEDMTEITIPQDMYFVMGDNRANSRDSRIVGLVARSQIHGHVRYVLMPFEERRSVN